MSLSKRMSSTFESQRKQLFKKSFFDKLQSQGTTQTLIGKYIPSKTTVDPLLAWYKKQIPELSKAAENEIIRMGKKIHKTTLKQLDNKLYGVKNRDDQKNIVNDYFAMAKGYRVDRIATTERTRAKSFKKLQNVGPTSYKKWITMEDDRVRKSHRMLGKKGWIPVTKAFAKGVYYPPYEPNCRCRLVTKSEKPKEIGIKDTLGNLINYLGGRLI